MTGTVLAVGGHIGDMDLTAGPTLAAHVLAGGRAVLLALTPGERGHPSLPPDEYRRQKIEEGEAFAAGIGAEFRVFADQSDGFLARTDEIARRVADVIRDVRADVVVAHWRRSIHEDHENACYLAERGRFLANLPLDDDEPRHGVRRFLHAENWEDADGFTPDLYLPIPDEAYDRWRAAIEGEAFARGETYGFRYIDYYDAVLRMRGCLAGVPRAAAFKTTTDAVDVLDVADL
ncbi:MAG TPA: PIG-L family deacetylase [Streptosporangiales bacterium]